MVYGGATATAKASLSSHIERVLSNSEVLSDRYYGIFLPWCSEVAIRLKLPAWDLYRDAWAVCTRDIVKASSSVYHLSYLTLKPVAILLWILIGQFWKFVLEHGGRSLHAGAIHLKLACIHFYRFQMSLNKTQLFGEASFVLVCVGLYYLRRWLLKQTYYARLVDWTNAKKRRLIKSYTDTVHQIAEVSKILAMALPHSVFFALAVGLMVAFPGMIRWITYETPTTAILSLYYPFFSTLIWVHTQRASNGKNNSNSTRGLSKQNDKAGTTPKIAERKQKFQTKAKANTKGGVKKKSSPGFVTETAALETTKYWLDYWQLYAFVQTFGSCLSMIPIVGRFLVSHPIIAFLTGECKFFFFVWIFGMEKLLGKTSKDAFLAEALPLRLIQRFVKPLVLQLHSLVSDAISKGFWQKWVVSKTKTALDIAVMVRALSEERRDWLIHVVEEARVLTLPSITLLMPGFITQFGVAYVQYMVPSAKSAEVSSKAMKLVYLQYWILHCGTAGLLHKLSGFLWWVPFSNHIVFLLWSYLILPQAITSWYGILESELLAFGILPKSKNNSSNNNNIGGGEKNDGDGTSVVRISDTKTAWLFHSLVQRLPSAVANESDTKKSPSSFHKDIEPPSKVITAEYISQQEAAQAKADEPIVISPSQTTESSPDVIPTDGEDVDRQTDQ